MDEEPLVSQERIDQFAKHKEDKAAVDVAQREEAARQEAETRQRAREIGRIWAKDLATNPAEVERCAEFFIQINAANANRRYLPWEILIDEYVPKSIELPADSSRWAKKAFLEGCFDVMQAIHRGLPQQG